MRIHESRRCLKCGDTMERIEGSQRTTPDKVWFTLRCPTCGHIEMDWHERKNGTAH